MVRSLPASSLKAVIVSLHQFISYANAGIQLKELLELSPPLILWYPCRQQTYTRSQPTFCLLPDTRSRTHMPTFSKLYHLSRSSLPCPGMNSSFVNVMTRVTHFGSEMAQKPYSVALWFSSLQWNFLTQGIALYLPHGYISLVAGR